MLVSELHGEDRGCLVTTVGLASDPSTLLPGETVLWAGEGGSCPQQRPADGRRPQPRGDVGTGITNNGRHP